MDMFHTEKVALRLLSKTKFLMQASVDARRDRGGEEEVGKRRGRRVGRGQDQVLSKFLYLPM